MEEEMDKWHVGKKIALAKFKGLRKGSDRVWTSEYYHGTKKGYSSHDLEITLHQDGSINFSERSGDGFIYLYPEQVEHLKKILRLGGVIDNMTLAALKGSIKKWENIIAGTDVDRGPVNCPLCQEFNYSVNLSDDDCQRCPVGDATGRAYCFGTPYGAYEKENTIENAQAELDFLKSRLPLQPKRTA